MAAKSNQVGRVMQEHLNLKRGDVVCVFMPNCAEFVWTWLGVAKLGGVSALINSNLRHKPLLHCIQVAKAKAIVFSEHLADGEFVVLEPYFIGFSFNCLIQHLVARRVESSTWCLRVKTLCSVYLCGHGTIVAKFWA